MHDIWNPWHGCRKVSEGCEHCYMYYLDSLRDRDGTEIYRTKAGFSYPLARDRNGSFKVKSGEMLRVCMTSDFFLKEADAWCDEAWDIMYRRPDVKFFLLTKRPERVAESLPWNWGDGWENVIVGCTVENQKRADERLRIFSQLPIKRKNIICQPMISAIDLEQYLAGVELVVAGGESDRFARPMYYDWVLSLREQCIRQNVSFEFRQCGTHFIKDGREYTLQKKDLCSQARKANINYHAK